MRELLTIEEALARILERVRPLPSEAVPVAGAVGRILAEPAVSPVDLPPFPSSAMDGFAVRARETPGILPVVVRVAAGRPSPEPLAPGTAAAIATGGAVPEGADTIVPVEHAVERDGKVELGEAATPGMHIRSRGGDVRAGDTIAEVGTRLGAAQIGALAAVGIAAAQCGRPPRAAVLATGSELRKPGEVLGPGEIFESNSALIGAVLGSVGAELEPLAVVTDDENAHRDALARGLAADLLVTSGGVSVGPHDLVRRVASELGVKEVFWGIAVKPGKPLFFGVREETLVFGLPGNPVSSLVGSVLFVRPALLALQGATEPGPTFELGIVGSALRRDPQRDQFLRARRRFEAEAVVLEPILGQESHMIVRAASADALVHVPRGTGELGRGQPAHYLALA